MIKCILTCDRTPPCDAIMISHHNEHHLRIEAQRAGWKRYKITEELRVDLCPAHLRFAGKGWVEIR